MIAYICALQTFLENSNCSHISIQFFLKCEHFNILFGAKIEILSKKNTQNWLFLFINLNKSVSRRWFKESIEVYSPFVMVELVLTGFNMSITAFCLELV